MTEKIEIPQKPDTCICCGELVPEGRMVCHACEIRNITAAPFATTKPITDRNRTPGTSKECKD